MSESGPYDAQVVAVLEQLGDEATYLLIRRLLRRPATQDELEDEDVKGLDQSGVSRRLKALAQIGLVRRGGRSAKHAIMVPEETFTVIQTVIDLIEAINRRRDSDLKAARKTLAADELASPALTGTHHPSEGAERET
jgi:DNA-binding HxlR family transcriptional regulator